MANILPPELLLVIFRTAASVPGALEVSPLEPLKDDHRSWDYIAPRQYIDSMTTKRALTLVCKYWKRIATELLFEHINLENLDKAHVIARNFESSTKLVSKENVRRRGQSLLSPVSHFVRRIEMNLRYLHASRGLKSGIKALASIIRHSEDLRILIVRLPISEPLLGSDILKAINPIRLPSLCHFACIGGYYGPPLSDSLQKFSMVQVLCLRIVGESKLYCPALHFNELHTLQLLGDGISTLLNAMSEWPLPLLHRMYLPLAEANFSTPFLEQHGSKLTFLDLMPSYGGGVGSPIASAIFNSCPSLVHLVVGCTDYKLPVNARMPPHFNLTRVSIRTRLTSVEMDTWIEDMVRGLDRWTNDLISMDCDCPALSVVRLIDFEPHLFPGNIWLRSHMDLWKGWTRRWAERSVRFEDKFGDLVQVPDDIPIKAPDGVALSSNPTRH
jgi:hypothetical protein